MPLLSTANAAALLQLLCAWICQLLLQSRQLQVFVMQLLFLRQLLMQLHLLPNPAATTAATASTAIATATVSH